MFLMRFNVRRSRKGLRKMCRRENVILPFNRFDLFVVICWAKRFLLCAFNMGKLISRIFNFISKSVYFFRRFVQMTFGLFTYFLYISMWLSERPPDDYYTYIIKTRSIVTYRLKANGHDGLKKKQKNNLTLKKSFG